MAISTYKIFLMKKDDSEEKANSFESSLTASPSAVTENSSVAVFPPTASILAVPFVFPVMQKSASTGICGPIGQDTGISVDKKEQQLFHTSFAPQFDILRLRSSQNNCRYLSEFQNKSRPVIVS